MLTSTSEAIAPVVVEHLQNAGIFLVNRALAEPLDQSILRQFDLVLMPDAAGLLLVSLHDASPGGWTSQYLTTRRNFAEIRRYVEDGGGLFLCPAVEGSGLTVVETLQELLGPWGVEAVAASARDDAHTWTTYAWTTNIAPSHVTDGVECLFYPIEMARWDEAYPTIPFSLHDPRWQPVVRSMEGGVVAQCLQYTDWHPVQGAQNPPVIAAIAELGRGRAALLGVNRFFTFVYPYDEVASGWVGEFRTGHIAGVVLERGDGERQSHGLRLITNMLKWAGGAASQNGMGGYTPETYAATPAPEPVPVPRWLAGWQDLEDVTYHKVLIGPRSAYSSGTGTVSEWAAAAGEAGYAVLVMTETLADFDAARWTEFLADCKAASRRDLVVVPGLDIEDPFGNRMILFGQNGYPKPWMLTADGRAMKELQYLALGFGLSCSAVARPTTCPLPDHLFKFFHGLVVYTYDANGDLVDNGLQAYQRQIYNMSNPLPLVVHELTSPEQVATAAAKGHQLYIPAPTVADAVWYMRDGMAHFWETPAKYLVTSGPMIRALHAGGITVESDAPITDVRYYTHYNLLRRWIPNATSFSTNIALPSGCLNLGFVWVEDAEGRTAVSPFLRSGQGFGYNWRCSDRQNFFSVAINYTGVWLSDGVDIHLPTFGTDEGKGLWPHLFGPRRGENLAPLLEFPYQSPVLGVTDAYLDQRYWNALLEEVAFDAKAPQGTSRSRVYDGRVRYYDLHYEPYGQRSNALVPMMLMEVELRLRQPVIPSGEVFPAFVSVGPQPECLIPDAGGAREKLVLTEGALDLPVGGVAGGLVALSPGLRVTAEGLVGFVPPSDDNGALPVGTTWTARWVRLDPKHDALELLRAMGLGEPGAVRLDLTRGQLDSHLYVANMTAHDHGVAGTLAPYPGAPIPLTARVRGVNWNWPFGVWQPAVGPEPVPCGVFEREGWARLDLQAGGPFYVGNLVVAGDSRLRIGLINWTAGAIALEVNNPTSDAIETTVRTPPEISGAYRLDVTVNVGSGQSLHTEWSGS